jgi:Arc/MetJ family transcription regulator
MKTTIEIADALLAEARRAAEAQGVTLRALVEEALRRVLRERRGREFRLRRASFKGSGLNPQVREGSWERISELIYEGRGG